MCSVSRYLLVAAFAGVAGSSLSGSDPVGLFVAAAAVLLVLAAERLFPGRLGARACALPAQDAPAEHADESGTHEPRRESTPHG